jgi:hypothetical protein
MAAAAMHTGPAPFLLTADDMQRMRGVVKNIRADRGQANVHLAYSAEEACRVRLKTPAAAVISAPGLTGMGGLQLLSWVRTHPLHGALLSMRLPGAVNHGELCAVATIHRKPRAAGARHPPASGALTRAAPIALDNSGTPR